MKRPAVHQELDGVRRRLARLRDDSSGDESRARALELALTDLKDSLQELRESNQPRDDEPAPE
jgi:hypothetical protein